MARRRARSRLRFLRLHRPQALRADRIGVLYAKREQLEAMRPFLGGGDMIRERHRRRASPTTIRRCKFEAGTPAIVRGDRARCRAQLHDAGSGSRRSRAHEAEIARLCGRAPCGAELAQALRNGSGQGRDLFVHHRGAGAPARRLDDGRPVRASRSRAGHHCAQPLMDRLGVTATCRASFGLVQHQGRGRRADHGADQSP